MSIVPKAICKFNTIHKFSVFHRKILLFHFCKNGKADTQIFMEWFETPSGQNNLETKLGDLHFPISKLSIKPQ